MASSRLLHGVAALAIAYALLAACTTFATIGSKGLRGVQGPAASGADFVRLESDISSETGTVESSWPSAANAVMLAAVLGLVAGMAPAKASTEDELATIASAQGVSKEARLAKAREKEAREVDRLNQTVESQQGSNPTTSVTLKQQKRVAIKSEAGEKKEKKASVAAVQTPTAVAGKNKVIFSPADDLDEDELDPSRAGQGLKLAGYLLILPAIYTFFWVAGSLNVI